MAEKTGPEVLREARAELRSRPLKFGDLKQIAAHRFWEAVEVLKARIENGARWRDYQTEPDDVVAAAEFDRRNPERAA